MESFAFLLSAFGLGLAYAAVPGVVNAEAMRRGFAHGFWSSFLIQTGSLLGDAGWAVLALSGAALLIQHVMISLVLGLIGSAFLFGLARNAIMVAIYGERRTAETSRSGNSFVVGIVFSVANPAGLAFWSGLGGGILGTLQVENMVASAAQFLVVFLVGAIIWGASLAGVVAFGRRRIGARFFRWINVASGILLSYFGFRLLWTTLRRFGRLLPLNGWLPAW